MSDDTKKTTVRVILCGARGRMGRMIDECAQAHPGLEIVGRIDMGDSLEAVLGQGDVVIDFSVHEATHGVAEACARAGKPLVIGTTGHEPEVRDAIRAFAGRIPMVWATNFSTGVNVLFWLTEKAAAVLGPDFDREVVEMHHRHKRDAPSGTAATLVEVLAAAAGTTVAEAARYGREGIVGARPRGEIGVHSLRGGDVVGDHTVVFAADGERVELTHRASSRATFANGALRAAAWLVSRPPGLYDMRDVLGLT